MSVSPPKILTLQQASPGYEYLLTKYITISLKYSLFFLETTKSGCHNIEKLTISME